MAIYRSQHTKNYTVLLNDSIRDKRLSFKARGIHHLILSYPDNWEINIKHLAGQSDTEGRTAIASGLKELEKCGYIKRQKIRSEGGTFAGWENLVFETPQDDLDTEAGKPDLGRLTEVGKTEVGSPENGEPGDIINNHFSNYPSKEVSPLPPTGGTSERDDLDQEEKSDTKDQPNHLGDGLESEPEETPPPKPPAPLSTQMEVNPAAVYAHPAAKANEYFQSGGMSRPWRLSSRRNDFDPSFVEWLQRYLNTTPYYQKKPDGCSLYDVKSYIHEGEVNEVKLSKLEARWHDYQQSLTPKSTTTPNHPDAIAFTEYRDLAKRLGHEVEYRGISEGSICFSLDGDRKWNTFDPKVALIQVRAWQITSRGQAS